MANIIVQVSVKEDFTFFTVEGSLNAKELLEYLSKYYMDNPSKHVLWDTRFSTVHEISLDELKGISKKLVTLTDKSKGGKTAFVINGLGRYGMDRMYKTFTSSENLSSSYRVFHSLTDARCWLFESLNAD